MTLSSTWLGLLGAGSLIGLFGSLLVGRLADRYGRRKFFMADMLALTLLSVLQLFTTNLATLLVIRIALGMAIAVEYTVGTALLMEWVPAKRYFAAYLVGTFTSGFGDRTWQVILASSAIVSTLAVLQRLVVRQPESPRWLASKGRIIEAINLVHRYVGEDYTVHPAPQVEVKKGAWRMLFSKKYRRRTLVGGLFYACQTFPFFGISIFLPILMENMNVTNPLVTQLLYYALMIAGVLVGIVLINRLPRRYFLIRTFLASAAFLLVLSIWHQAPLALTLILFSLFSLTILAALVMDYAYPNELFDASIRTSGVGMCIAISRIGAVAGTFMLPIISNAWGSQAIFIICGTVLLIGGIICYKWAPETSLRFAKHNRSTINEPIFPTPVGKS
ncbi:D-xylose proton-symporter [Limosilactobacillus fermentum]|nr:MFS transporter [Limosilactobacillus fermentum]BAW86658.1 D-xylose proton-symporter [Limosilactobacillus fermentum]